VWNIKFWGPGFQHRERTGEFSNSPLGPCTKATETLLFPRGFGVLRVSHNFYIIIVGSRDIGKT
jgi:hypothetical protein